MAFNRFNDFWCQFLQELIVNKINNSIKIKLYVHDTHFHTRAYQKGLLKIEKEKNKNLSLKPKGFLSLFWL